MGKQSEGRESEYYKGIIRNLRAEIKHLKKQIKQLQRDNQFVQKERVSIDEDDLLPNCPECGKGYLKEIELVNRRFIVCSVCDFRKKV